MSHYVWGSSHLEGMFRGQQGPITLMLLRARFCSLKLILLYNSYVVYQKTVNNVVRWWDSVAGVSWNSVLSNIATDVCVLKASFKLIQKFD